MLRAHSTECVRAVFTDVDGTLIDEAGQLPRAWPDIRRALLHDALVVLTSSRTVEELLNIQQQADLDAPVIAENGAIIAFGEPWLDLAPGAVTAVAGRRVRVLALGTPRAQLISIVRGVAAASGVEIEWHSDSAAHSPGRGPQEDPLPLEGRGRSHSLLLRFGGAVANRLRFAAALATAGVHLANGGRWYLVQGGSNKGLAAQALVHLLRSRHRGELALIGVGNAENDRPMLEAVTTRFVMRGTDGDVNPALAHIPGVHIAERPGVDGWIEIVAALYGTPIGGFAHA